MSNAAISTLQGLEAKIRFIDSNLRAQREGLPAIPVSVEDSFLQRYIKGAFSEALEVYQISGRVWLASSNGDCVVITGEGAENRILKAVESGLTQVVESGAILEMNAHLQKRPSNDSRLDRDCA